MIKKRITLLFVAILCSFMTTGCISLNMNVSIDKKGNMTNSASLSMPTYLVGQDADLLKESILNENPDSEVNVYEYESKTYTEIKNSPGNISKLYKQYKKNPDNIQDFLYLDKKNSFLYDKYSCTFFLKDVLLDNLDEDDAFTLAMMDSMLDFSFRLELPMELIEGNNTHYIDESDGIYTYIWNYSLSEIDDIYVSFKVLNLKPLLLTLLAIFSGGILLFIRRNKSINNIVTSVNDLNNQTNDILDTEELELNTPDNVLVDDKKETLDIPNDNLDNL